MRWLTEWTKSAAHRGAPGRASCRPAAVGPLPAGLRRASGLARPPPLQACLAATPPWCCAACAACASACTTPRRATAPSAACGWCFGRDAPRPYRAAVQAAWEASLPDIPLPARGVTRALATAPVPLQPTFAVTTATVANPAEHAQELLGVEHVHGAPGALPAPAAPPRSRRVLRLRCSRSICVMHAGRCHPAVNPSGHHGPDSGRASRRARVSEPPGMRHVPAPARPAVRSC